MRFILLTKASRHSEAGIRPSGKSLSATKAYYDELEAAGVLVAVEGFMPSSSGLRLSYPVPGHRPVLTPGPLHDVQELISGYVMIEVNSEDEAIAWALRMPDPNGYGEGAAELRRMQELPLNAGSPFQQTMEDELRLSIGLPIQGSMRQGQE
ncbi:YciI family protein [Paenibacillus sp. 1P07SE]|uniref:YciI family protein n=1 Tax=Paenibacillus sp. 1P07SE TaxID=3132209 RepID=UPI0039A57BF1